MPKMSLGSGKSHSEYKEASPGLFWKLALLLCLLAAPLSVRAHAPSDTFLSFTLTQTNVSGRWEVKVRDLQHALGLDTTTPIIVRPEDLRLREEALGLDTVSGLNLKLDGTRLPLRVDDEQWTTGRDGESLVLTFQ